MSEPASPGESQRGAPRFFVGCEDDESEGLEDYDGCSMRTDMELYEDDEDTDSVRPHETRLHKITSPS
jgi:hypothetical protein